MSRASVVLGVLTDEPASTSDLYDRVGYLTLTQIGLVRYEAFRAELVGLAAAGLAERHTAGNDGPTMWRRAAPGDARPGDEHAALPGDART